MKNFRKAFVAGIVSLALIQLSAHAAGLYTYLKNNLTLIGSQANVQPSLSFLSWVTPNLSSTTTQVDLWTKIIATQPAQQTTLTIPDPGQATSNIVLLNNAQTTPGELQFADLSSTTGSIPRSAITIQTGTTNPLALTSARNLDGSVIATAGGSGLFAVTGPGSFGGTSGLTLKGESAEGNTKTDVVQFETVLPQNYVAGSAVSVVINAGAIGSGTLGATKTLTVDAFTLSAANVQSSNLGPSALTLTTSNAAYTAALTSTTFVPGTRLLIQIQTAVQETGGSSPLNATITGVSLTENIQG